MRGKMNLIGKALTTAILCLAVVFTASCAKHGPAQIAEGMVDAMAKGDFKTAASDFGPAMKTAMPADKLQGLWTALSQQAGAFKGRTATREAEEQGFKTVYVTCSFDKMNLDMKIVFDGSDRVVGMWLLSSQPAAGEK